MKTKHQLDLSAPVIHRGDQNPNNPIRGRWFALRLGGLLLTSVCALLPSPAQAQCQRWDVGGQWVIHQKGGGRLQVNLQPDKWQQQSANITGTGRVTNTTEGLPDFVADITGNITGNALTLKVTVGTSITRYLGTIGSDGKIAGEFHSGNGLKIHWYSLTKMKCADEAPGDSEEQTGKHKKKGKHKGHHHHDDDDQDQGND